MTDQEYIEQLKQKIVNQKVAIKRLEAEKDELIREHKLTYSKAKRRLCQVAGCLELYTHKKYISEGTGKRPIYVQVCSEHVGSVTSIDDMRNDPLRKFLQTRFGLGSSSECQQ